MKAEFEIIAEEIINNSEYQKLINECHHGLTRYDHSLRVAKWAYKITKKLNLDYVSATRAALLHDFFTDEELKEQNSLKKIKNHPDVALNNATNHFILNDKEIDAIKNHMFPLTLNIPSSKEGLIMNLADTGIAIYECGKYKLSLTLGIWLLFVFNVITFNNK